MAEEMNNGRLSLDTSKKDLLCNVITVKAPNFFTLPEYGSHFEIRCPRFEFQNSSWCFILRSPKSRNHSDRDFRVCMERINSRVSQQKVFYIITLLDANDKNYVSFTDMDETDEDDNWFVMGNFCIRKPSFDKRDTLTLIIHLLQFNESTGTPKMLQIQDLQDTETEKRSDCKVSLKFSKKFITCNVYTLKFSNAVQEQNSTKFEWKSPSFEFDNETCCLRVCSVDDGFYVNLLWLSSEKKKHNKKSEEEQELTYLHTLQANDEEISQDFSTECISDDENEYELHFIPKEDIKDAALDKVSLICCLCPKTCFEVDAANMSFTISSGGDRKANEFVENLLNSAFVEEVNFLMLDPAPMPDFSVEFRDRMKVFGEVNGNADFKQGTLSGLSNAQRLSECHYEPNALNCTIAWEKLKLVYEGKVKFGKMPSVSIKGKVKLSSSNAFLEIVKDPSSRPVLKKYVCLLGNMEIKFSDLGLFNRFLPVVTEGYKQHVMTRIFDTMTERLRYAFERALTKVSFPL